MLAYLKKKLKVFKNNNPEEILIKVFNKINSYLDFPRNGITRYQVDKFMELNFSNRNCYGLKVLDVGGGHKPYKKYFKDALYESCDSEEALEDININIINNDEHTFFCDITKEIPRANYTYDIIICNEVFEHLNEPQNAACEIYRILKKKGEFYLTVPQCHGIHMPPHNYFNFLSYGIDYILKKAGFIDINIIPLGGIYRLLAKVLGNSIHFFFTNLNNKVRIIFYVIELPIRIILFFVLIFLFSIDKIDAQKNWTINYGAKASK